MATIPFPCLYILQWRKQKTLPVPSITKYLSPTFSRVSECSPAGVHLRRERYEFRRWCLCQQLDSSVSINLMFQLGHTGETILKQQVSLFSVQKTAVSLRQWVLFVAAGTGGRARRLFSNSNSSTESLGRGCQKKNFALSWQWTFKNNFALIVVVGCARWWVNGP